MKTIMDLLDRMSLSGRKVLWRVLNDYSPNARALYIFGAQRSGTTMLLHCLERAMAIDVLGESSHAMVNFRIRSNDFIRQLVARSHHQLVVFKPLTDSHRVRELLELVPNSVAIWAYRRVEDRVNSSVAKFGDHNWQVLQGLARGQGLDRWQAMGLTADDFAFLRSFDYSRMSPHSASALFWYLRNMLFFRQQLDKHSSVLPLAYEDLVTAPTDTMRKVCLFVGVEFVNEMTANVHATSIGRSDPKVAADLIDLCNPIYERLHAIQNMRFQALGDGAAPTAH